MIISIYAETQTVVKHISLEACIVLQSGLPLDEVITYVADLNTYLVIIITNGRIR